MKKQLLNLFLTVVCVFTVSFLSAQYVEPMTTLEIPPVEVEADIPVIDTDGSDAAYSDFVAMTIAKEAGAAAAAYDTDGNEPDFNSRFKVCWDLDYLYLYAEVIDDVFDPFTNGKSDSWTWDNVEVFIDLDTNATTNTYDANSTIQLRFCPGLLADDGSDSIVETRGRADYAEYITAWDEVAGGYTLEVAIPWVSAAPAAMTLGHNCIDSVRTANTVIGFDVAVADSDTDGSGDTGGRNVDGGQQMFWELDEPIGNEDNTYQNRRVFGWAELTGNPAHWDEWFDKTPDMPQHSITFRPNPVSDKLYIEDYNGPVAIYSVIGIKLMELDFVNETVDVSGLNRGVYILATTAGNARFVLK
jgi:hypothetical protein